VAGSGAAGSRHLARPPRRLGQLTPDLPAMGALGRHPPRERAAIQIGNGLWVRHYPAGSPRADAWPSPAVPR